MICFSEQAADQWIKVNLCSTPPVIQVCNGSNIVPISIYTHTHTPHTKSETWHTSGVYYICVFTFENKHFAPTWGSGGMLNFTLTRATAWPFAQHRRHSFSPCVVIFHSQPPRSGHLKPGWSGHFVCWACVSSPASRAEGSGRKLEYLSADSFKEQRARDGSHMLDSYPHNTVQKGCDPLVTTPKSNHTNNRSKP